VAVSGPAGGGSRSYASLAQRCETAQPRDRETQQLSNQATIKLPTVPCDHIGPTELIEMAETHLVEHGTAPSNGMRFRWSENPMDGMWGSIVTEIERRGEQWIVTRLDRNREPLPQDETGFRAL
jgi:hypothetical protein